MSARKKVTVVGGGTIVVPDVTAERDYMYPDMARKEGLRSLLSVPMMVRDAREAGATEILNKAACTPVQIIEKVRAAMFLAQAVARDRPAEPLEIRAGTFVVAGGYVWSAHLLLLSAKDGEIIKNLTPGYTGSFENIVGLVGEDSLIGRNLCWTPDGNHIAFFGRFKKRRALILVDVLESKVVKRIEVPVDRALFPHIDPTGEYAYFTALRDGISDVWRVNLQTETFENVTKDDFYDKFPTITPDGKWLYYSRRISGFDKIYRLNLDDMTTKEQVTFGTHDDASPIFSDDGKLMFYTSNEDDGIFNVRSLDIETGDIIQYTDVLGGNFSPSVIKDGKTGEDTLLFTSYYKGNYGLYRLPMDEPVKEITADMIVRTEGPVIDFVPPVSHQVISENKRSKSRFEKFYVDGAPPIATMLVDGGLTANAWAMQFLADICGVEVARPAFQEVTALGAAKLTALGAGLRADEVHVGRLQRWSPHPNVAREALRAGWQRAVAASLAAVAR